MNSKNEFSFQWTLMLVEIDLNVIITVKVRLLKKNKNKYTLCFLFENKKTVFHYAIMCILWRFTFRSYRIIYLLLSRFVEIKRSRSHSFDGRYTFFFFFFYIISSVSHYNTYFFFKTTICNTGLYIMLIRCIKLFKYHVLSTSQRVIYHFLSSAQLNTIRFFLSD